MKLTSFLYCLLTSILFISSCKKDPVHTEQTANSAEQITQVSGSYQDINVEEAQAIHRSKDGTIFLDVRTPSETKDGIIEGAQILDYRASGFEDKLKKLDKDTKYVVYCKAGGRSANTMAMMKKHGFVNVRNMKGGYTSWSELNK